MGKPQELAGELFRQWAQTMCHQNNALKANLLDEYWPKTMSIFEQRGVRWWTVKIANTGPPDVLYESYMHLKMHIKFVKTSPFQHILHLLK
ncbi:MAG: hypothetical protein H6569_05450 [Lewinellaceae bacterium]|nr:hypothetical protein [Lewinellaceae bacterium]